MGEWNWELRLFLSADIVGSTAYKVSDSKLSDGNPKSTWPQTFAEFFSTFPDHVSNSYEKLPSKCHHCEEKVVPWKFSGDEILFSAMLSDHRETASHVLAFKHAILTYPETWKRKRLPLHLKATGWVAGFPVTNRRVTIGQATDFIGPSIDLGFRLTKFASMRNFVLSAGLTLMVLDAIDTCEIPTEERPRLHLIGLHSLKGVIDGRRYPIIVCDVNDGKLTPEEELLGDPLGSPPDTGALKYFVQEFLDSTPQLLRPFIAGESDCKYSKIPEVYEALRKELMAEEREREYSEDEGPDAQGGDKDINVDVKTMDDSESPRDEP